MKKEMQTLVAQPIELTSEHLVTAFNWISDMSCAEKWRLSIDEATDLLGGISVKEYLKLKRKITKGFPINLNRDIVERINVLLGIHKSLCIFAPENRKYLIYGWFNQPNTNFFAGKSIEKYLLDRKTFGALYDVRRFLDAATFSLA